MKSNALRKEAQEPPGKQPGPNNARDSGQPFQPRSVRTVQRQSGTNQLLRMYTEEEVSEILQVSLSQLRKWRMRKHQSSGEGPPFRKIGRLVRYSGIALQAYINGDDPDSHPNQE
jgi:Helix-turn-helix domain